MKLATFRRQPDEREYYSIDYTDDLAPGDYITAASATSSAAGLVVDDDNTEFTNTTATFWTEDGATEGTYKVEVTATTLEGRIMQDEITIKIKEI